MAEPCRRTVVAPRWPRIRFETIFQLADVVLKVVQILFDIHFPVGTADDAALQLSVDLIFEPIPLVVDPFDEVLDVLVARSIGGRRRRHRRHDARHHERGAHCHRQTCLSVLIPDSFRCKVTTLANDVIMSQ